MPTEILDLVILYLQQKDLCALMRTNSNLTEVAAGHLYRHPLFASTYRYAQFAHTVSHKKQSVDLIVNIYIYSLRVRSTIAMRTWSVFWM